MPSTTGFLLFKWPKVRGKNRPGLPWFTVKNGNVPVCLLMFIVRKNQVGHPQRHHGFRSQADLVPMRALDPCLFRKGRAEAGPKVGQKI